MVPTLSCNLREEWHFVFILHGEGTGATLREPLQPGLIWSTLPGTGPSKEPSEGQDYNHRSTVMTVHYPPLTAGNARVIRDGALDSRKLCLDSAETLHVHYTVNKHSHAPHDDISGHHCVRTAYGVQHSNVWCTGLEPRSHRLDHPGPDVH